MKHCYQFSYFGTIEDFILFHFILNSSKNEGSIQLDLTVHVFFKFNGFSKSKSAMHSSILWSSVG
jgi:hypothetical protein